MFNFSSPFKPKPKLNADLLSQIAQFVDGLYVAPAFSGVRFSKSTKTEASEVKFSEDIEDIFYSEEPEDGKFSAEFDDEEPRDYKFSEELDDSITESESVHYMEIPADPKGRFALDAPTNPFDEFSDYHDSPLEEKVKAAKRYDLFVSDMLSLDHSTSSFVVRVQEHIAKTGVKDSTVYKAAGIDRRLFSHMMSDREYQPSKDTAIAVCLGLKLSLYDTYVLLNSAGYTLSSSIKRDQVFKYFIMNENYDLQMINETLYNLGYKTLGRQ